MKQLKYVLNLIRFAFIANPLLYVSVSISLCSVFVELLAMSSLFPLFQLVSEGKPSTDGIIARLLLTLGFEVTAIVLLWAFIVLLALRIITQLIGQSLSMYLGKKVMAQLSSRAFDSIVNNLSLREISENSIGFYIGVAGDEAFRASTLVISMTQFVSTAALAGLYFAAIVLASPVTAGLVMLFIVCSSLVMLWVLKASHRLGGLLTTEQRRSHAVFLDSLNNLKALRAFSAQKYISRIYHGVIFGYTRLLFLIDEIALLAKLLPMLLLLAIFSGWLIFSAASIKSTDLALLVTMIVYLMRFFPTVGDGAHLLFKIVSDAKSGKDVTAILGAMPTIAAGTATLAGPIQQIDLRDVGFSYHGTDDRKVLSGVTLQFDRGNSYALVGKSGAGKSSLIDLLLKFHAPCEGELLVNGVPLERVDESEVRKRVLLINQEPAIFDETVANNIRLGLDASDAEVRAACEGARIHEDIERMPLEYETRLQYLGKNLSGGQRQRIAIARALLRHPDVLILDESTSALDKVTQEQVVAHILREYAQKIVIFITHDPQIMRQVTKVVDLQEINFIATMNSAGEVAVASKFDRVSHGA